MMIDIEVLIRVLKQVQRKPHSRDAQSASLAAFHTILELEASSAKLAYLIKLAHAEIEAEENDLAS